MPTIHQSMLQDRTKEEGADGSPGNANKNSLKRAFPRSPQHDNAQDTEAIIKAEYQLNTMTGIVEYPGSDFPETVDMDYGTTLPTHSKSVPVDIFDANLGAFSDNTIVPGGKGPTVATLDIDSPTDPGAGITPIDGSTESVAPFVPPTDDGDIKQTSRGIGASGLHGGVGIVDSGELGTSTA